MSLRVVEPGWATRVVDFGRPAARSLGVPVGGAADRFSLAAGNGLVGNPPDAAALEIALTGPRLVARGSLACAVFGAPFVLESDRQPLRAGTTFTLEPDEELRVGGTPDGVRAYLCVRGGLQVPETLGSRSGLDVVKRGDELACSPSAIHARFAPELMPAFPAERLVRALPGLQADWFDEAEFYGREFVVTPASNRMGLRLKGTPLTMPRRELVSEPVCPGAVQVTRDGQCIVLGVDGQTIGGYPKVAQVIAGDLDVLGQLRPGSRLRFERVGLGEAVAINRRREAELQTWLRRLHLSLDGYGVRR